jgi:hypothetical protein
MVCRREGWLAPRYDRAVAGGAAAVAVGAVLQGVTYSVTVERSGGAKRVFGSHSCIVLASSS